MSRYRNKLTGVVVDIPDDLAAEIGAYEPVERPVKQQGRQPRMSSKNSKSAN